MLKLSFESISIDNADAYYQNELVVDVLRLDKISPVISGNKWFKLRYHFETARQQQKRTILTFGGAWSNHIVATAAACQVNGFSSTGIIRGERPSQLSPTLQTAQGLGMQLVFITRGEYACKTIPAAYTSEDNYVIDEGGRGILGAKGAATILEYSRSCYTHICCAVGTGTMMAGLINACEESQQIVGIQVLKNHPEIGNNIESLLIDSRKKRTLITDYHFGGYAKSDATLIAFMNDFYRQTNIPSDFVYTAKLFYAIQQLADGLFFPKGSKLLLVHSGGLQGNQSLPGGTLIF